MKKILFFIIFTFSLLHSANSQNIETSILWNGNVGYAAIALPYEYQQYDHNIPEMPDYINSLKRNGAFLTFEIWKSTWEMRGAPQRAFITLSFWQCPYPPLNITIRFF